MFFDFDLAVYGAVFTLAYFVGEYAGWCKTCGLDPRDLANIRRWLRSLFGRDDDR